MVGATHEEAKSDNSVAHNHHCGEDRVARQAGLFGWSCDHHRDDQRGLNSRDGQGQHQRAEWLANAVRNHLRVVKSREHSAQQGDAREQGDQSATKNEKPTTEQPRTMPAMPTSTRHPLPSSFFDPNLRMG